MSREAPKKPKVVGKHHQIIPVFFPFLSIQFPFLHYYAIIWRKGVSQSCVLLCISFPNARIAPPTILFSSFRLCKTGAVKMWQTKDGSLPYPPGLKGVHFFPILMNWQTANWMDLLRNEYDLKGRNDGKWKWRPAGTWKGLGKRFAASTRPGTLIK